MEHGIPHNVLNAKYHEKEAAIIAEAGRKGAVTIATNMAGRGVDILLGGSVVKQEPKPEGESDAENADTVAHEEISFRRGGKVRRAAVAPLRARALRRRRRGAQARRAVRAGHRTPRKPTH